MSNRSGPIRPRRATGARRAAGAAAVLLAAALLAPPSASPATGAGAGAGGGQRKLPLVTDRAAPGPGAGIGTAAAERGAETVRRRAEVRRLLGGRGVSRKSRELLRERGLGPARLSDGLKAAPAALGPDTLRVLLVRISFDGDRSGDLTSVTTDGDFQFASEDTVWIDPPPHDRRYFEAHLRGLDEYYRMQSGGRLVIQSRVLPEGDRDSYQVRDLAEYGPGAGGFWTLEGLESLIRDMMVAADEGTAADATVNLADYDDDDPFTYIIFVHAGSDWQSDVAADSPNDVPTFFVTLGDPVALDGVDSETGDPGRLSECSVIPETTNQDGWFGSIAAGLYHEFGHALGLVDIYDSWTGLPRVGFWDLMDAGTNVIVPVGFLDPSAPDGVRVIEAMGVLPSSLGPWEKWYLGWLDPAPLAGLTGEVRLPAIQVPRTPEDYQRYRLAGYDFRLTYPQAVIGGASRREFFLVENRWVPETGAQVPEQTGLGLVQDDETGVILYLGGDDLDPRPDVEQYRNTGLYDFFLLERGAGVLVWHVDMARVEAGLADNSVNVDGDGVRLVEADGIQDVGELEPYVIGFWGSETDPFNEVNGGELHVDGRPSSRAFDRSWTGLRLRGIAGVDDARAVMRLNSGLEPLLAAAPFELPPRPDGPRALAAWTATPAPVDGAPALVVAAEDDDGGRTLLYAVAADGRPVGAAGGLVATLPAPLLEAPILAPELADGLGGTVPGLVVGLEDGTVRAYGLARGGDGMLTPLWSAAVADGARLLRGPVPSPSPGRFLCQTTPVDASTPVTLTLLSGGGEVLGSPLVLDDVAAGAPIPLPGGIAPAGAWAVPGDGGWHLVRAGAGGPEAPGGEIPYGGAGALSVQGVVLRRAADAVLVLFGSSRRLRRDGRDERRCLGGWRLAEGGAAPLAAWDGLSWPAAAGLPAAADLDGDGEDDLVLTTADRVHALTAAAVPLTGWPVAVRELFPLPDTTRVSGSPIVCDADGDGVDEVLLATDAGHLIGLDARGGLAPRTPFLWGESGASAMAVGDGAGAGRVLWLLSEGGRTGPPLDRRLLDGRVVGYGLPAPAAARTSEWLGRYGDGRRLGAAGIAREVQGPARRESEADPVVLYPNPVHDRELRVRFRAEGSGAASLAIYDLAGELVLQRDLPVAEGLNDLPLALPDLASGLYLCRLVRRAGGGTETTVRTLAVVR